MNIKTSSTIFILYRDEIQYLLNMLKEKTITYKEYFKKAKEIRFKYFNY